MSSSVSVKVAIRMRPFNKNEEAEDARAIIDMNLPHKQVTIRNPAKEDDSKSFTYDFLYNSFLLPDDPDYASQDTVWNDLGKEVRLSVWLVLPASDYISAILHSPLFFTASGGSLGRLQLLPVCVRSDGQRKES